MTNVASTPWIFEGEKRFNKLSGEVGGQERLISIECCVRPIFVELLEDIVVLGTVVLE